jgi:ribulose-bisphosphate carboxylase small chain
MRITQGTFSYLPDLSDQQIVAQLNYCVENSWVVSIEHTDDPHPRNSYWEMWSLPMFDLTDTSCALAAVQECRKAFPNHYVKVSGFDSSKGRQTTMLSFLVNRPPVEPGFWLERNEGQDRRIQYTIRSKRKVYNGLAAE